MPLLLPKATAGRLGADDRRTINGILYVLTIDCRWMDICQRDMAPTKRHGKAERMRMGRDMRTGRST
jgi:transposase